MNTLDPAESKSKKKVDENELLQAGRLTHDPRRDCVPMQPPTPSPLRVHQSKPHKGLVTLLSEVQAEVLHWLIPDLIPMGDLTVLIGAPKAGKSTLTRALAAAVTTGEGLPSVRNGGELGPRRDPAGVVLAAGEDSPTKVLQPCLAEAGADLSRIALLDSPGDPDIEPWNIRDLGRLDAAVDRVRAALVVIDPYQHFLPENVNPDKMIEVRRALKPLRAWASRRNIAVLIVAHPNKRQGTGGVHVHLNGSIDLAAQARSLLVCARRAGHSILAQQGSNLAPDGLPGLIYRVRERKHCTPAGDILATWVEWGGTAPAEHLLGGPEDPNGISPEDKTEAADVLRQALSDGPRKAQDVRKQCLANAVSERAMRDAKRVLDVTHRIIKVRGGGRGEGASWWALPAHASALNALSGQNEAPSAGEVAAASSGSPMVRLNAADLQKGRAAGDPT